MREIRGGSVVEAEMPAVAAVWPAARPRSESPFAEGMRRLCRSATALVGLAIVAVLLVVALLADVLAPQSPIASDQTQTFARPSWEHPLGTDQLGRDMLSRVIHGSRLSLIDGLSSVVYGVLLWVWQ